MGDANCPLGSLPCFLSKQLHSWWFFASWCILPGLLRVTLLVVTRGSASWSWLAPRLYPHCSDCLLLSVDDPMVQCSLMLLRGNFDLTLLGSLLSNQPMAITGGCPCRALCVCVSILCLAPCCPGVMYCSCLSRCSLDVRARCTLYNVIAHLPGSDLSSLASDPPSWFLTCVSADLMMCCPSI